MNVLAPGRPCDAWRVRAVQAALGVDRSGVYDDATVGGVRAFQRSVGLGPDGIVGPLTWDVVVEQLESAGLAADIFERVGFDAVYLPAVRTMQRGAGGMPVSYHVTHLRADVAGDFRPFVAEVEAGGAVVTSAGGRRDLSAPVSPGRVAASLHHLGLAHDLATGLGMHRPQTDVHVLVRDPSLGPRRWRVWARGVAGRPGVVDVELDAVVWGRREPVTVRGPFLDLTAAAARHGFVGISARELAWWEAGDDQPTSAAYSGAEWWHLQRTDGLVVGETLFGDELLRVYPLSRLAGTAPWGERHRIYGVPGPGGWR